MRNSAMRDGLQLCLFENSETAIALEQHIWTHSLAKTESSLHALAPYAQKSPVAMVRALLDVYCKPGEVVLDPFCGSGVIPLEAVLGDRIAWASDLNPYAYTLTRGKLEAPRSQRAALEQVSRLIEAMAEVAPPAEPAPSWVQDFFHPETLRELRAALQVARSQNAYFLLACLLGLVQDVRSQGLSYPADPEGLFLRSVTYGATQFPELYGYRNLRSRLIAKVKSAYRHHGLPADWDGRSPQVWQSSCTNLAIPDQTVDTILTGPPYPNALDSVQSHRLRLWCLGYDTIQEIQESLIDRSKVYMEQMTPCFQEMDRVLKPKGYCILLVRETNSRLHPVERLAERAIAATQRGWVVAAIYGDMLPAKRGQKSTRDRILVLQKMSA